MGSQRVRQDWVTSLSFHFMSLRMKPAQGTEDLGNEEKYNSGISFSDHRFIVYDIIMGAPPSTQAWTWNLCSFMSQLNLFVLRTQFGLFFFFLSFVIRGLDHGNQAYVCPRAVSLDLMFISHCLPQHDFTR